MNPLAALSLFDEAEIGTPQGQPDRKSSVSSLVSRLKEEGQDHEWYPTTDEILFVVVRDLRNEVSKRFRYDNEGRSFMDIGAGNGKVLRSIRDIYGKRCQLFAIEKSDILRDELDDDMLVVGTEFMEQSLLNKQCDVIFCNPPYSEFAEWSAKIIRESCAPLVYLVIPDRWMSQLVITDAIKFRDAEVKVIGEYDFLSSEDRTARARVNILKVSLSDHQDDAFVRFFDEQFSELKAKFKESARQAHQENNGSKGKFSELVIGASYPEALVSLYLQEIEKIQKNYMAVGTLDADLLRELEISPTKIMDFLRERLKGLKNLYWKELFDHLTAITSRLTAKSRDTLLKTLHSSTYVDFTMSNIYAIILWAVKNSNRFIESQLIDTYELMVDKCCVHNYKSNQRVWIDQRWRYADEEEKNSHFALDYRIVAHRMGGLKVRWSGSKPELDERAATFLGDLMTIANNLGFHTDEEQRQPLNKRDDWNDNSKREFFATHPSTGKRVLLLDVRAFLNGNIHMRLNQDFILALNVEFGRLKGWLTSGEEAASELQEPKAALYFNSNIQLSGGNPALLLG